MTGENQAMYLSTLFLSELGNGAGYAIQKCNDEFLNRLAPAKDSTPSVLPDAAESSCDEIMALWDVYRDYEMEILVDLPVIRAMRTICAARKQGRR